MASYKYTYSITGDFPNQKVDPAKLTEEIHTDGIITALDFVEVGASDCNVWFMSQLSVSDSTTLDAIIAVHDGEPIPQEAAPTMSDGRPIVRADTRPLDTSTYFTTTGDSATGIGDGVEFRWDFSDATTDICLEGCPEIPDGYKAKEFFVSFTCPINVKDGTIYFFDAPWGQHIYVDIMVPAGNYYPNPAGVIPASALGLSGSAMYSYATVNTVLHRYVNKHFVYGNCPMGDELNAEGSSVDALPPGWYIRALIVTPENDNESKGFGSLEMYRCHTALLPGQTMNGLHS